MTTTTVKLCGTGPMSDWIAAHLGGHGYHVRRIQAESGAEWTQSVQRAIYVLPDPSPACRFDGVLGREPATAYAFGRAALEAFRERGFGRLVYVIRSFLGLRGSSVFAEAAAVSATVMAVSRSLAATCIGSQVTVNTLAVGFVQEETDMRLIQALSGGGDPGAWILPRQARFLRPEEVVASLRFLLSTSSSAVNGAVVPVDATLSARL